jgi:hypothetical protein
MLKLILGIVTAGGMFATSAGQILVNGGFESGDFTGWTRLAAIGSMGDLFVQSGTGTPLSGNVTTGAASGSYFALTDQNGPGAYSLSQAFTVSAGVSVLFSFDLFARNFHGASVAGSLAYASGPRQFATVDLLAGWADPFDTGPGVLRNFYLGSDAFESPRGWTRYSFDISDLVGAGGTYRIRFGQADNLMFFNMGVDNVAIDAAALGPAFGPMDAAFMAGPAGSGNPEPATIWLLGCGAALIAVSRWRKRPQ